jgi:hypothetical protein
MLTMGVSFGPPILSADSGAAAVAALNRPGAGLDRRGGAESARAAERPGAARVEHDEGVARPQLDARIVGQRAARRIAAGRRARGADDEDVGGRRGGAGGEQGRKGDAPKGESI